MKKIIISCFMLCLLGSASGWAQVVKGTKYLGAGVSLSGSNSHVKMESADMEYKTGQFSFNPSLQAGRFYKDNRMFGISLSTNINTYSYEIDGEKTKERRTTIGLAPFLRQYKTLGTKWFLFLQESVPVGYSFYSNGFIGEDEKENGYNVGLSLVPGISFKVSERFLVESDINLLSIGINYTDQPNSKSFSFQCSATTGIASYFGIRAAWFLAPSGK